VFLARGDFAQFKQRALWAGQIILLAQAR
jgi:hypothetical protein